MVRSSKPSLLSGVILLALFIGGLVAVHVFVDAVVGREIADVSILIVFFVGVFLWGGRG